MKWILGVICLTSTLAAVSATLCNSEDDCREGYCCVGLSKYMMKRRGLCLRLARKARHCNEEESKSEEGKFLKYCPCAEGLVCQPNKPGITDPDRRQRALRCQKPTGSSVGPDVTTVSKGVTDDDVEVTTRGEIVTEPTLPDKIVTDDDIVEETDDPEKEVVETDAPEEVVETDAPEEVVETDAPEEVVETDAPEEEVVETDAPEEVVETDAPEEEVVETDAPEEDVVDENPEEVVEEGPGGERPRPEDPDCEDWTYGC